MATACVVLVHGVVAYTPLASTLFQPFVRLSKDAGGHGLGLMIVRRVVERMNGSVHVSSVVGQGSVFSLSLPRPSAEATVLP